MELKDFVKQALVEITEGVKEAQDECSEYGALINPRYSSKSQDSTVNVKGGVAKLSMVKFNVAVTSTMEKGSTTKIGVLFSAIGIGNDRVNNDLMQSANIIQFEVPVVFPIIDDNKLEKAFKGITLIP